MSSAPVKLLTESTEASPSNILFHAIEICHLWPFMTRATVAALRNLCENVGEDASTVKAKTGFVHRTCQSHIANLLDEMEAVVPGMFSSTKTDGDAPGASWCFVMPEVEHAMEALGPEVSVALHPLCDRLMPLLHEHMACIVYGAVLFLGFYMDASCVGYVEYVGGFVDMMEGEHAEANLDADELRLLRTAYLVMDEKERAQCLQEDEEEEEEVGEVEYEQEEEEEDDDDEKLPSGNSVNEWLQGIAEEEIKGIKQQLDDLQNLGLLNGKEKESIRMANSALESLESRDDKRTRRRKARLRKKKKIFASASKLQTSVLPEASKDVAEMEVEKKDAPVPSAKAVRRRRKVKKKTNKRRKMKKRKARTLLKRQTGEKEEESERKGDEAEEEEEEEAGKAEEDAKVWPADATMTHKAESGEEKDDHKVLNLDLDLVDVAPSRPRTYSQMRAM